MRWMSSKQMESVCFLAMGKLNQVVQLFRTLELTTVKRRNNTYLGHPDIEPIWKELNRRKAVVFVHPTHPVDLGRINSKLPQPSVDYPHETTRTAMDMLTSGTRQKYPDAKVILSHAGGTLPYLISRVTYPLALVNSTVANATVGFTYEQMTQGFRSFHYDLALSTSPVVLKTMLELVPADQLLYGVSTMQVPTVSDVKTDASI